jgi:hypothetical protein
MLEPTADNGRSWHRLEPIGRRTENMRIIVKNMRFGIVHAAFRYIFRCVATLRRTDGKTQNVETSALAILWTAKSSNEKTGPIPVSTTGAQSCPDICEFNSRSADVVDGGGCYAEHGAIAWLWRNISAAGPHQSVKNGASTVRTTDWQGLCDHVTALDDETLWRHDQAGDFPHQNQIIDAAAVSQLVAANSGRRGFTYTHHDPFNAANAAVIAAANAGGFTVNLSGNNLQHADKLAQLQIGPVVVVLPIDYQRQYKPIKGKKNPLWLETLADCRARLAQLPMTTDDGNTIVVCPATYRDDTACINCQLCQRQRKTIVGFPAHGAGKAKASGHAADAVRARVSAIQQLANKAKAAA